MSGAPRSVRLRVSGRVQHVGFRWFVERRASDLGLAGWVRNAADGSVEVSATGVAERVEQLIAAVRQGPPHAIVRTVDVAEQPAPTISLEANFEILP